MRIPRLLPVTALLLTLLATLAGLGRGDGPSLPTPLPAGPGTVLLELFTSQGCSSCPPADRLLSTLAAEPAWGGRVVALAFHVDYWNYIGWQDPFSDPLWSHRQRAYGRRFGQGRIYTPQLVLDGAEHCVGSQEAEVRRRLAQALARPDPATLLVEARLGDDVAWARVVARRPPGASPAPALTARVALVEDGLQTSVRRGENAGHSLRNDRVVRILATAFELPSGHAHGSGETRLPLPPDGQRERLSLVVFLQDLRDLTVHAVAQRRFGGGA